MSMLIKVITVFLTANTQEGKVCFEMGGGLNFGLVVAGAIGSENRFSYRYLNTINKCVKQ